MTPEKILQLYTDFRKELELASPVLLQDVLTIFNAFVANGGDGVDCSVALHLRREIKKKGN